VACRSTSGLQHTRFGFIYALSISYICFGGGTKLGLKDADGGNVVIVVCEHKPSPRIMIFQSLTTSRYFTKGKNKIEKKN